MTEVSLYKLTTTPLEKTLPKLMEKIFSSGMRAVLMSSSKERVQILNKLLWTYTTTTFLPHGAEEDDFAEDQPIWLTNRLENPNNAQVLVLCDGAKVDSLHGFKRCLDLYDGNDPKEISDANQRINSYVSQGCVVAQWRQGEKGAWEKVTS